MMSKKDAITLGMLAIGGIGVASMAAGSGGGDAGALEGVKGRAGGILGAQKGYGAPPTIYNLPAQPSVTFPKAPSFDISSFLGEPIKTETDIGRGAAGVSAAPKKSAVRPYLYTGGEVEAGAVSVAPWAMGVSTPAEIGVTTALSIAQKPSKKYDYMGTGMTQSEYKSQTAHRTYSSPATAKKTSSDASKAVSHAKRLRAGRGD
jgi:hypothetical protein